MDSWTACLFKRFNICVLLSKAYSTYGSIEAHLSQFPLITSVNCAELIGCRMKWLLTSLAGSTASDTWYSLCFAYFNDGYLLSILVIYFKSQIHITCIYFLKCSSSTTKTRLPMMKQMLLKIQPSGKLLKQLLLKWNKQREEVNLRWKTKCWCVQTFVLHKNPLNYYFYFYPPPLLQMVLKEPFDVVAFQDMSKPFKNLSDPLLSQQISSFA